MDTFHVRLRNGATAILVADEKPLYLKVGAEFYTVEDLIAGEALSPRGPRRIHPACDRVEQRG
jgi:hypothetical protein